jgi:glycine cleavage system H protein
VELQASKSQVTPDRRRGSHGEWLVRVGDVVTVGLTRDSVDQLGPLVHIQLPTINSTLTRDSLVVVLESSKAAIDCYAPICGRVVAINTSVFANPGLLNESPEGAGWLYRLDKVSDQEWQALPVA